MTIKTKLAKLAYKWSELPEAEKVTDAVRIRAYHEMKQVEGLEAAIKAKIHSYVKYVGMKAEKDEIDFYRGAAHGLQVLLRDMKAFDARFVDDLARTMIKEKVYAKR